jgi:hypothetical protein
MKNLIRRILKEEKLSKSDVLKKHVLKNGWEEVADRIGGFDNLYRIGFNNDYNEFLKLYSNLEVVQSEENSEFILYRFEKGNNVIMYNTKSGHVYVNFELIWSFFRDGIGLKFDETQDIMKRWLDEVYNLDNVIVQNISRAYINTVLD